MRIVFMGTPEFSVPTLTEIVSAGHEVVAVYTQPPRPAGRGQAERKSPVHLAAEGFGIPVLSPKSLRGPDEQAVFALHDADLAVVVAYGLLLPKAVLEAPRLGCLNLHGSLLPRWRGAAPIQRAIMAGDARTGVMVMKMDEGLDTGPVALAEEMPIGPEMTAGELHDQMMRVGADLMGRALAALERGSLDFSPQPVEGVTYARKIDKAEARIDWTGDANAIHNQIRGLSPFPGAWFEAEAGGQRFRIKLLRSRPVVGTGAPGTLLGDGLTIACSTGAIRVVTLQREGKAAMDAETFLRGTSLDRIVLA
ncbi:methionyl-tRNA formyltransferase [Arsenicitalea aurantiaca]|uniref:Methionyl-tRNA formyltransferase n=1 Tax=Arsenicitalea aurantiaca TaxID=1783274 RepID=A0A433X274_9HYPH|nr:methionyl-tRNA formyltransferase [Arsenicitalea aurantiaca]RUT28213.1 methionyl-tRNA formyltransferase [Arsenicitalea aurantiaca]